MVDKLQKNQIYFGQFYRNVSEDQIKQDVVKDGFDPILITNVPGYIYSHHKHPETKILVFLKGSMDVKTLGKTYHCVPGDKLIVPGGTFHQASVGKDGCTFFWSEKIV